jgi:hypothetical protein
MVEGYGSGKSPSKRWKKVLYEGYFAKVPRRLVAVRTTSVSDFANAVATLAASRLRNWKCTSASTRSRSTKLLWRGKECREPGWGWMTWMTNNRNDQDAPQKAGQGGAGIVIGRGRRFRLRFGGDWGTLETF